MDAYAEHIRQLPSRFGRICWDLVYTADVHMRSEQFERIRWKLHTHTHPEHGYTDANPWNAVLAQATREDAFWSREVITPATLRLAQAKSIPAALQEADKPRFPQESEAEPGTSSGGRSRNQTTNRSTTGRCTRTTAKGSSSAKTGTKVAAESRTSHQSVQSLPGPPPRVQLQQGQVRPVEGWTGGAGRSIPTTTHNRRK